MNRKVHAGFDGGQSEKERKPPRRLATHPRAQHRRRILRGQDDQDVPDTAISRAEPPGEPTPTDAALSLADSTEETEHLTSDVETEDTETVVETEHTI